MVYPELTIFTHIPKTAGTSTRKIIYDNYSPHSVYQCYRSNNTPIKVHIQHLIQKLDTEDAQAQPLDDTNEVRLIVGHFGFGIHELLPARFFTYMAILRNPIERVTSYYYHLQRVNSDQSSNLAQQISLKDFIINSNNQQLYNWQTRFLAGGLNLPPGLLRPQLRKIAKIPYNKISSEILELAKINLRQHYIFGIQEQYEESLKVFAKNLNWQNLNNIGVKLNVNPEEKEKLDQETWNAIFERNQFDMALYNYAKDLFEKRL